MSRIQVGDWVRSKSKCLIMGEKHYKVFSVNRVDKLYAYGLFVSHPLKSLVKLRMYDEYEMKIGDTLIRIRAVDSSYGKRYIVAGWGFAEIETDDSSMPIVKTTGGLYLPVDDRLYFICRKGK